MTSKLSKDLRIEQIINAAASEFVEHGYENTSMEQIARRAGLTKGGVYHHFQGKDDILLLASQKLAEPLIEMMQQAATIASATEALSEIITRYLSYWNAHRTETAFYFLSMVKAPSLPHLAGLYEGYTSQMVSFYRQIFARGLASGEFRDHDSTARALSLAVALDGALGYLLVDSKADVMFFVDHLKKLFIQDIQQTHF